ncbi:MAG: hypothetical protein AB8B48_14040 [Pseudomonadales bacterium]
MKPCKRIEIVIEHPLAPRLSKLLVKLGAPGYTMIDGASGRGDRGTRRADEITGISSNSVFIIACDDDALIEAIIEGIRPILSTSGGICLVSDAQWLRH